MRGVTTARAARSRWYAAPLRSLFDGELTVRTVMCCSRRARVRAVVLEGALPLLRLEVEHACRQTGDVAPRRLGDLLKWRGFAAADRTIAYGRNPRGGRDWEPE